MPNLVLQRPSSTPTLRPVTPKSIVKSQQQTQWRWQNFQCTALGCELFITLLFILIFILDPVQACMLEARSDLRYIFNPLHPLSEERYTILLHLYRMVTSTANEPVLKLSSEASRMEIWKAFHKSVLLMASPLTTPDNGSVKAVDIANFLNRVGRPMDLSDVHHWNHRLWHTLPFQPPWRLPSPTDLTIWQESEVTAAMGALQDAITEPAFDPDFLVPIAVSRFPWSSMMLQDWAQTAHAAELAFQARLRFLESRTDRQGMVFLVVVVLVHYFLLAIPPRSPPRSRPPGLIFDFSEESFYRSLEALTTYVDLFDLQDLLNRPAFVRVQHLRLDMTAERVKEWRECLRGSLQYIVVDHEDESIELRSSKEGDLVGPNKPGFHRLAWDRGVGLGRRLVLRGAKSWSDSL